jgi:hypothetical protein
MLGVAEAAETRTPPASDEQCLAECKKKYFVLPVEKNQGGGSGEQSDQATGLQMSINFYGRIPPARPGTVPSEKEK